MSLRHLLLGMLDQPASGYDLRGLFARSVTNFWSAELAQIYPALSRLEKDGLVTCQRQPSRKGPERKVYRRTRKGRAALRKWLAAGPALRQERLPFLAQVMFLAELPPPDRRRFLEALEADFASRLRDLNEIQAEWRQSDPRYPDALADADFFPHLVLELGKRRYAATLAWCADSLAQLARHESRTPRSGSRAS